MILDNLLLINLITLEQNIYYNNSKTLENNWNEIRVYANLKKLSPTEFYSISLGGNHVPREVRRSIFNP